MTIDKIKLRRLAKDKDERFFEEGDMLDALNAMISADGESSGGVLKNIDGTLPGTAETTNDQIPNEASRVVGSVSDPTRGYVYFFVWSTTSSNHAIYRYDVSNHKYKVVLKSSVLGFQKQGFVKAEIINNDFKKDGSTQTVIYFTDTTESASQKPPRKINVDRVLEDGVNNYSSTELEELLSVVKSPILFPPTVTMLTDTSRKTNGLYGKTFQAAVQLVYKDGEESALSPHSTLFFPKYMSLQGIVNSNVDQASVLSENVAHINTRWGDLPVTLDEFKKEVSKIKLLVSENNSSVFYLVDEFDPNSDVTKNGLNLYSASSGIYKFYNDGLYTYESTSETDRVYDDVPQKAAGQAISGNRLMYSAPTSGYPNVNARATISVNYEQAPSTTFSSSTSDQSFIQHNQEITTSNFSEGYLKIDTTSLAATISANTTVSLLFEYKPSAFLQFGWYSQSGGDATDRPLYRASFIDSDGDNLNLFAGEADDGDAISDTGSTSSISNVALSAAAEGSMYLSIDPDEINWRSVEVSYTTTAQESRASVVSKLYGLLTEKTLSYSYFNTTPISFKLRDGFSAITHEFKTKKISFDISFNSGSWDGTNGEWIQVNPMAWNYSIPSGTLFSGLEQQFVSSGSELMLLNVTGSQDQVVSGSFSGFDVYTYFTSSQGPRLENGFPLSGVEDRWGQYTLSPSQENGARNGSLFSYQSFNRRTFKAGSKHKFGIVYFDKHGRPGRVNELGSVDVLPFGNSARTINSTAYNGPCTISVDMLSQPPSWASSYQIVYPGMSTWEKFVSFSVGGGFFKDILTSTSTNTYTEDQSKIYVSFNTLLKYQSDKGALKDYAYTPGDKLRVISYMAQTNSSNLSYTDILYDVVGYSTEVADIKPDGETADDIHTNHKGKFLILNRVGGQDVINFEPDGQYNFWGHRCVVEILTPKKSTSTEIFYEIGESRKILGSKELTNSSNNKHNDSQPIILTEGDTYYGARPIVVPNIDTIQSSDSFSVTNIEDFVYQSRNLESMDASDFFTSRAWSKGRPHIKQQKAATIKYENRIVYSEEFKENTLRFPLSSFNPASYSFKDLPKRYGSINYIGEYNQSLVCLQENKLSYVPVNRNIVEYLDGDKSLTASSLVLSNHQESNGDFGVGNDASSVLIRDGMIFFADSSRRKIMMARGPELTAISDVEMSSYFESNIESMKAATGEGGRIISGFDSQNDMIVITIEPKINNGSVTYPGTTVGYSITENAWISRYSFKPSNYATIDNLLLSSFWYQNADNTESYLMNAHRNTSKNTIYGTQENTEVSVISKISPSEVKVFNAISYEGNSPYWDMNPGATTNLGQISGTITDWSQKEGSYYSIMPKDVEYKYVYIGTIAADGITIGSQIVNLDDISRLDRFPFRLDSELLFWHNGESYTQDGFVSSASVTSYDLSSKKITLSDAITENGAESKKLFFRLSTDGNAMRGHWMNIKIVNNSNSANELYCINTHIMDSKSHHPKGQQ